MELRKVYDEFNIRMDEMQKEINSAVKSNVTVTQTQTSAGGTKIASISVDGSGTDIYAPAVAISDAAATGTKVCTLSIGETSTDLYAPTPEAAGRGIELVDIKISTDIGSGIDTSACDTDHVYAVALLLQKAPTAVNAITLDTSDATTVSRKDIYVDANHSSTVIFFTLPEAISAVDWVDFPEISASEKMGYALFQLNNISEDEIPTDQADFQVLATKDQDGDVFTTTSQSGRDCTIAVVVDGNKYSYGNLEMADPETEAFKQGTACNLKAKATTIVTEAQQVYMNCNQSYAQGFCLTFDKVTT